jgi:hypothetical protein
LLLVIALSSCGSGLQTPATIALCDSSLTFSTNIAPIVAGSGTGHCAACHAGKYDNKDGIQANRNNVFKKVNDGSMPLDNTSFKDTSDGQTFLAWASCPTLK